ncbi:hypothetical protein CXG81DRAFT_11430 [Caulochytrium protostelioides]|uniref:Isocitrate/isopropylmalate dehydrogenase n=1 Tax=Caulochytrium protostelioides TaxID=1555241 RepID=A0A4P9WWQ5_9FUNG|nr:Isocitrate/isopropylmalate dehydrogenase [Caulochytrium protostelioides]RKP01881.1 hypothetical protein CXG81DRAFT_11430 [Caulochytrium protostelioides]|eukprot:RKP01881.1 hypothetical protein CXG81DRAFT_11430 [Caulochytrium protostelioides]
MLFSTVSRRVAAAAAQTTSASRRQLHASAVAASSATPSTKSSYTIGLIPGDGIGHEVIPAAAQILSAVSGDKTFDFVNLDAGFEHFTKSGTALPEKTVSTLREACDGALFGAVSSPSHKVEGYASPIVQLRKELDLYANVRPVRRPRLENGTAADTAPLDLLILRENTECLYIKQERIEQTPEGQVAWADRRISERASRRIGQKALDMALARYLQRGHATVTIVHKSNVLSVSDGLFRTTVRDLYAQRPAAYQPIQLNEQLVDSLVYRLYREPHAFDVLCCPNLYGDIVSDAAAALVGSLGLVAGANVGDRFCLGEPVHGSAPDIAGQGIANPIAAVRSAALLLHHLDEHAMATRIERAVDAFLTTAAPSALTPDLPGGKGTTQSVLNGILAGL